ncbi:MAG TPA: hypothetical protein VFR18_07345 [Terriglobia bacterium]|nr:hypothetical protein [Terriglobia bacterium]
MRVRQHHRCWLFSLLIAGPAIVLALLGLCAVRADRVEREQHLREHQTQTARLADAAIANVLDRLRGIARETDRLETPRKSTAGVAGNPVQAV